MGSAQGEEYNDPLYSLLSNGRIVRLYPDGDWDIFDHGRWINSMELPGDAVYRAKPMRYDEVLRATHNGCCR